LIGRLANEIAQLSGLPLSAQEYYGELLQRLLAALAAPAGAVWLRAARGDLQLECQINLRQVGLDRTQQGQELHDELLRRVLADGHPGWLSPRSELGAPDRSARAAGNPTDYHLLLAPVRRKQETVGAIEVWQQATRASEALRGALQFLVRIAGFASRYAGRMDLAKVGRTIS
jgi:hypothetical protein